MAKITAVNLFVLQGGTASMARKGAGEYRQALQRFSGGTQPRNLN
jgi:hypothetical protein